MKKILIANRGEIAIRILRACRLAGYEAVVLASEADKNSLHVRLADEHYILPGATPTETYLNQQAILNIACEAGVDAVHPGYGLLSENEHFAAAVIAKGMVWIGPSPDAISRLGDKVSARAIAESVGAPLLPSLGSGSLTVEMAQAFVAENGYPVIIKAQNGGGGRGMRVVRDDASLAPMLAAAQREASIAFGRSECYIERFAEGARHVETQCLADQHGNVFVLSTRDCTLQRRQQKLVEEAPAPFLSEAQIETLTSASTAILKAVNYHGAATCEYLILPDGTLAFLEVNARVQVEHPVTEEVTGIDIIGQMFRIAEGQVLDLQPQVAGHAIEFRINAENIAEDFRPTPGQITYLRLPSGQGIRLDFGHETGDSVQPFYDSLVGKIIVKGKDRADALARARVALREFAVTGIDTVTPLHQAILERGEFAAADGAGFSVHTRWIDTESEALISEASAFPIARNALRFSAAGAEVEDKEAPVYRSAIKAPLSGLVIKWLVEEGDLIAPGDAVAIMESMKMEQTVEAEVSGMVVHRAVDEGGFIDMHEDLLGVD